MRRDRVRHVRAERFTASSAAPDAVGPTPLIRALVGLLLGVGAGILGALLLPRASEAQRSDERAV